MADEQENADPVPEKKSGLFGKIKILVVVVLVLAVECVLAYFFLPSEDETLAMARERQKMKQLDSLPDVALDELENPEDTIEIDLGDHRITLSQPQRNTTLQINFHLHAIVGKERQEEMTEALEKHRNAVAEQVLVIIRSADLNELHEPGLGLIKRKILDKVNRILGKPLVTELLVTQFSFLEQ